MRSENNIKILVLTSTFPRWEQDTEPPFVMELSKRLHKKNIDVDVLAPHTFGAEEYELMEGISVYRYKYFFSKWELLAYDGGILANLKTNKFLYLLIPFFLILQMISAVRLIKYNNYDLIHAHWLIPQGLICVIISKYLYKTCPKILCTSHGGDLFAFKSKIFIRLKKWILNNCDGITVVSEYMKEVCLKITDIEEKIYVRSMGVDFKNTFIPIKEQERESNKILFVGRLVEKKGVSVLINTIFKLHKKYPEISLVIVGDGPDRYKLEEQCKEYGIESSIHFFGPLKQEQLPQIYSSSLIAVMPSIVDSQNDQEGLGLVAIEAMACECVVIASSLPAVKDIITHNYNGILVTPGDSDELSYAIENLLTDNDLFKKLQRSSRNSVFKKYDWDYVTEEYYQIINTIVG